MRVLGWGAVVLALAGCGAPVQYRNYQMPAVVAPSPPEGSAPTDPVSLSYRDSAQFGGGIRMVLPDRAAPAPAFLLHADDGVVHTNDSLRGRVVWMDLWAVWCATCRAEFPEIERIHQRLEDDGLTVLAVCRNSTREGFEAAARKTWLSFPVVDASGLESFAIPYGAFPTSLVLDRAGRVRAYWQGHRPLAAVERLLRSLLAESAPEPEFGPHLAPVAVRPALDSSAAVVTGELRLPRHGVAPGEVFQGRFVLDLDPGWHVNADARDDTLPLELALAGDGLVAIDWLRPRTEKLTLAGGAREVYSGRVEFPLWGVVADDASASSIEVRLAATVQACDSTQCLLPTEIFVSGEVPVAPAAEEEGPPGGL